jgi:hypothetical protein
MCSITAYMILEPVVSCLGMQTAGSSRRFLFMTALAPDLLKPHRSLARDGISYRHPECKPYDLLALGISISLLLFALAYILKLRLPSEEAKSVECLAPEISMAKAWIPLVLPIGMILMGA